MKNSRSGEIIKMKCLFELVSKLAKDRWLEYWLLFLENNQSFEDFEKLQLTPSNMSFSGSAVPIYSSWISFLEKLLPHFTGLKWIQHKKRVEDEIISMKNSIEQWEINEIFWR